jgi:hypothetical protein
MSGINSSNFNQIGTEARHMDGSSLAAKNWNHEAYGHAMPGIFITMIAVALL